MVPAWTVVGILFLQGASSTESPKEQAERLHNEGHQLFETGKVEEGRDAVFASLAIHERLGDKPLQAINLRLLAFIHDGIGERQKAIGFYERALALMRATQNRAGEASTLRDLGTLYYNLDDNARAFRYFEQALPLQRQLGKPATLAVTLFSLSEFHRYSGNQAAARPYAVEALELARNAGDKKNQADVLGSLAMLDLKDGRLEAAAPQLDEALALRTALGDRRGEASTRIRRGLYFRAAREPEKSAAELRQAADIFESVKYRGGEAFARQALAMLERERGNLAVAYEQMLRAVELAEGLRQRLSDRDLRSTYIGYVQNRYEFLIDVLLELDRGDPQRAFAMSERARARALVEALGEAGISNDGAPPALSVEAVQQQVLDEGTALVEYALSEPASHLFVITRQSIVHHRLPGRRDLEATARKAYEAYRQPTGTPNGPQLAKLLLPDVRARRLLIVADGALQYLPFAHFAPSTEIAFAPSASAIAALRSQPARPPAARRLAVFADPLAPTLARLPFARLEAESILNLLPADKRYAALGADATREAVIGHPAAILHFAAHGLLDSQRPERTELVLAGSSLRLRDIYNMRVSSALVVLSACQTALGKEMKREGLLGLARAFQQAGAPRVVASLWKVDDRATSELMKEFYTGMLRDAKPPARALRDAQRTLAARTRWSHPYYWAGFILQGEWR